MVILAAPVTDRQWLGSVIGLGLACWRGGITCAGRSFGVLIMPTFGEFVTIILFRIIDILGDIVDGLVVIVYGLVCQLAEEVSMVWFHPCLLASWRGG